MKDKHLKQLYESLLETDQLKGMSGEWEEDKNKFIKFQKELEEMANIIEVNE
jgi:hypothetical protein